MIAAGVVIAVKGVLTHGRESNGTVDSGSATSLAIVTRRSLSEQTQLNGVLGFVGSFTVLGHGSGTLTWLPHLGDVIHDGQVLYRSNQAPVALLYGAIPAYRSLSYGASGADVGELNHDLVSLGYLPRSDVDMAWHEFGAATMAAVAKLQNHLGVAQTGELVLGDVVFLPTAARITTLRAVLAGPATGVLMTATSTTRTVSVALDPSLQSEVRRGDRVMITLPDGRHTPGIVTSVGTVATVPSNDSAGAGDGGSGPTVRVEIRPTRLRSAARFDQALVEVAITDRVVRHVMAVPVDALLARAGGGYAVEVLGRSGARHVIAVAAGLFDDAAGEVQVSGSGLAAGQRVVVPGQ
ncbi:MAG TPA: peptidoglycan-binding domain-containing protein [Mycobacteriales bacterium]|nr:peptidoglycan-binding domain-containing protein [Mycobacteriales bacterium]